MKNFKVVFTVFDKYLKPDRENWKAIANDNEYEWTTYEVETDCIETSEWHRKGSIGVDNIFIHDDYRGGLDDTDCKLFVNINEDWVELKPKS